MTTPRLRIPLGLVPLSLLLALLGTASAATPEQRALAYLAREVPRWRPDNGCFSCHHNGDAARALYQAERLQRTVPAAALEATTEWLAHPERWDHNGGDGPFSDKRLARLQFTAALAEAVAAGAIPESKRPALNAAARRLAEDQADDGSWPLEGEDTLGTPATWGRPLATARARLVLRAVDPEGMRAAIARSRAWLEALSIRSVPQAAAILIGLDPDEAPEVRQKAARWLQESVGPDGAWGPYATSPPEPFDTALALLALKRTAPGPERAGLIARGRKALIARQYEDGSWPETTRPAGFESQAQRLSTAAWATLALLETAAE